MVKHILKLIWNERKANAWLFMEYVLVFCILWFCTDFIYSMTKARYSDTGYDITDVYKIGMSQKPESVVAEANNGVVPGFNQIELVDIFLERVGRHPDVESVSISYGSMPYSGSRSMGSWSLFGQNVAEDSLKYNFNEFTVSSGFFDVFGIIPENGRIFDWEDTSERKNILLVPSSNNGDFGGVLSSYGFSPDKNSSRHLYKTYNVKELEKITSDNRGDNGDRYVTGYTKPLRREFYTPYRSGFFQPLDKHDISLQYQELAVRVKPDRTDGFEERFMKDMYDQLQIGPYYLSSVKSMEDIKKMSASYNVGNRMKSSYAVTFFILVNVFLGIMGTFWFRTQSRRSEIGLRMAMGSSRKKVIGLFAGETLLMLFLASLVGTVVCLNINNENLFNEILEMGFRRSEWGISKAQDIVNYFFSFLFLAAVSLFAVWYPAKQAADTQPAEVLHEE